MKYIKKVAEKPLWNAGFVELWDFSRANENEESRIEAVATVASICYGKPPKDAKKLVERLWTESAGLPSSAFEFVRSGVYPRVEDSLRNFTRHSEEQGAPGMKLETDTEIASKFKQEVEPLENIQEAHKENIATFKLKVPVFIARQVMRHRSFSYQELSRRYVDDKRVPLEFWVPSWEDAKDLLATTKLMIAADTGKEAYKAMIDAGIRAEIARSVLPLSLYTQFWMMGDSDAWRNYFALRLDKHAQKEHRELARAMLDLLEEHQPEIIAGNAGIAQLEERSPCK